MTYALFLLLMLLSAIWGASFLFIKIGVSEMGPLTFAMWRVFIGSVVLITVIRLRREKLPTDLRTWSRFAVMGVFNALAMILLGLLLVNNLFSPIFPQASKPRT